MRRGGLALPCAPSAGNEGGDVMRRKERGRVWHVAPRGIDLRLLPSSSAARPLAIDSHISMGASGDPWAQKAVCPKRRTLGQATHYHDYTGYHVHFVMTQ